MKMTRYEKQNALSRRGEKRDPDSIAYLADKHNINRSTLYNRLWKGMELEEALRKPVLSPKEIGKVAGAASVKARRERRG